MTGATSSFGSGAWEEEGRGDVLPKQTRLICDWGGSEVPKDVRNNPQAPGN